VAFKTILVSRNFDQLENDPTGFRAFHTDRYSSCTAGSTHKSITSLPKAAEPPHPRRTLLSPKFQEDDMVIDDVTEMEGGRKEKEEEDAIEDYALS
jgi:hypothetical protein